MKNLDNLIHYFNRSGQYDYDKLTIKIGAYFEPYGVASENWEMVYQISVHDFNINFTLQSNRHDTLDSLAKRVINEYYKLTNIKIPNYYA